MNESTYPQKPRSAVGAIVFKNQRVLLVKRKQDPNSGTWAIPGGRIKLGETLKKAAEREILEETGIVIKAGEPIFTFDYIEKDVKGNIRFHYIIVDLEADYIKGKPNPGDDAMEVKWISADELETLSVSPKTLELLKNKYGFGP